MGKGKRLRKQRAAEEQRKGALNPNNSRRMALATTLLARETLRCIRRDILRSGARVDSCILSTRVYCELALRMGFRCAPMTVEATVLNPVLTEFMDQQDTLEAASNALRHGDTLRRLHDAGGHMVVLGARGEPPQGEESWPGHLIAVLEVNGVCWGVDLSLDQAQRPKKRILLEPVAFRLTEAWLEGEQVAAVERTTVDGKMRIEYAAFPYDITYEASPDWSRDYKPELSVRDGVVSFTMRGGK